MTISMMTCKYYLTLFLLFMMSGFSMGQVPKVACGSIKRLENFQSKYIDPRNVDIWLPDGYTPAKKYAVLYMHDGQALYDSTITWNKQEWGIDETLCRLNAQHLIKECIVVGTWNNGAKRHQEYFPQQPFYSMSATDQQRILDVGKEHQTPIIGNGPKSDDYLKFLVTELKPYIDQNFSTLPDQRHTYIGGSSMGGLISMYAICEYPEVFGAAICMSTHWPGIFSTENNPIPASFLAYLQTHLPSPKNHKLYFDYGSLTLDAMYKPYQLQADDIIRAKGYGPVSWETREFAGADHSERSWSKRLAIPLLFVLKK